MELETRITLTTVFTGPIKGLKRVIREFLSARNVGCILQTTMLENDLGPARMTLLVIEGEKENLYLIRDELVAALEAKFPGIKYTEWELNPSNYPFKKITIKKTPNSISRDSSGADIVENGTPGWSNEKLLDFAKTAGFHILDAVGQAGKLKKTLTDSYSGIAGIMIHVSYNKREFVCIEIISVDWDGFLKLLKDNTELAVPKDKLIKKVYTLLDKEEKSFINGISGLKADGKYYIQTEDDDIPKFSTMEEIFKALKDEEGLEDEDIALVKEVFVKQKLKFKQLMETGDLAITDEKLKEDGITQRGLRTAILSLIKSNRK